MSNNDFMAKLMAGKDKYEKEKEGSGKRRRFAVGLSLQGRLLPFEHDGSMRLLETFHHHYYESMSSDSSWVFAACPKNNAQWDEVCEFCDAMGDHYKSHGSDNIYNAYKRKRKYKVNFLVTKVGQLDDYSLSDTDKGLWEEVIGKVVTLDLPFTLKQKIDNALNDEDLGLDIFNPANGFDLRIKVSERQVDNKTMPNYDLSDFARKQTSVTEDAAALIKDCQDLVEAIQILVDADKPRIRGLAAKEGLVAGSSPAASSAPSGGADESVDTVDEPSSGKEDGGDDGSLMDIFEKYGANNE